MFFVQLICIDPNRKVFYHYNVMVKAIFPGSFDPPTNGHLNVIERARRIYNEVFVVVATNSEKKTMFTPEERYDMLCEMVKDWKNVSVRLCDTLVVEYAKQVGASVLIRGLRNIDDFSYEFDLSMMNKTLNPDVETVFMPTDPKYFVLRSSAIKELAAYGGDISSMVPGVVAEAVKKKFSSGIR